MYSLTTLKCLCSSFAEIVVAVFPDTASVHTHPASSAAYSGRTFFNPLLRLEKFKSARNLIVWRANSDIFESDAVE